MVAENRRAFESAMHAATNLAWEGKWEEAVLSYREALTHSPDDVDALAGMGMALSSVGLVEGALDAYRRAVELEPGEPVLMERVGKTLAQLGRGKEAAEAFLRCGTQYLETQEAPRLAAECFEAAVEADPECIEAHASLLEHYQRRGQVSEAIAECLALAGIYRNSGRADYAIRICEHALQMSPRNPEVLAVLDDLRYGEEQAGGVALASDAESADGGALNFEASGSNEPDTKGSPVELTRRKALTDLAESVFEEQEAPATKAAQVRKDATNAMISKAIDFQTRGQVEEAITAYERVIESGVERPAVYFNLGLLYQQKLRFDEAVDALERAVSNPDYRLGSHFALGECYRARGRTDEALDHFVEVLKIVDLATIGPEHADDLIDLYEHLTDGYLLKGDQAQALDFANSLVAFLGEQGWEDKVRWARQQLDALTHGGPVVSLAEALTVPEWERILESIAMSQEYVRRGLFYTAMEECHFALEVTPNYLPIHRQLAEVSLAMGKVEEAAEKLAVIADTHSVRQAARQAAGMYERALGLAPMNTEVRVKLIDLLTRHGEIDRALEHHLILADSYYHLAQMSRAREAYQEALRLAPRGGESHDWTVRILHKIGDIDMQRVDWRRALSVYERIRDVVPSDERARLSLIELYYRLGQPEKAIKELDDLLETYREEETHERVIAVLNDLVDRWPDRIPLRARIAQAHLDRGQTDQALKHLDRLGDLQLDAGKTEEATATIEAIVALNPTDVEEYRKVLNGIEPEEQPDG